MKASIMEMTLVRASIWRVLVPFATAQQCPEPPRRNSALSIVGWSQFLNGLLRRIGVVLCVIVVTTWERVCLDVVRMRWK